MHFYWNTANIVKKSEFSVLLSRVSIELSDRFELSDAIHFHIRKGSSMPGIHPQPSHFGIENEELIIS